MAVDVGPENSTFIRRRDDSKNWFRSETGELERNIRWAEVGDDAISPAVFPAVKPKKNEMSTWDDAQWPGQTRYPPGKLMRKTRGKEKFMLTEGDIVDLCFRERSYWISGNRNVTTKEYLCRQLERRAWEKFGGPGGMKKARELSDDRRARRAAATSRATHSGIQHAPPSLVHLPANQIDADSGLEIESSSPPLTPAHQGYRSLGFLDLTLSDSDDEQDVNPQLVTPRHDIEEIEVIELSD